jgi:transcriptional regulator with XRE-family HTH domain
MTSNDSFSASTASEVVSIKPLRKRHLEGFSESETATTRKVQELYGKEFSSKRIPQDVVASKVGWSQATLNLYINGKQKIGEKALRKFCILFNVTPDVLSSDYHADKFSSKGKPPKTKEVIEIKSLLLDLIEAIDNKRDLGMILMRAKKHIVNE